MCFFGHANTVSDADCIFANFRGSRAAYVDAANLNLENCYFVENTVVPNNLGAAVIEAQAGPSRVRMQVLCSHPAVALSC